MNGAKAKRVEASNEIIPEVWARQEPEDGRVFTRQVTEGAPCRQCTCDVASQRDGTHHVGLERDVPSHSSADNGRENTESRSVRMSSSKWNSSWLKSRRAIR